MMMSDAHEHEDIRMNIDEIGGGALMKAADLSGTPRGVLMTISAVTVEVIRNGKEEQRKGVVHFVEHSKGLALNATNKDTIRANYGRETDSWVGLPLVLYLVDEEYMGKPCKAIRVRPPKPEYFKNQATTRPAAVAAPVAPSRTPELVPINGQPGRYVIDDELDIPF